MTKLALILVPLLLAGCATTPAQQGAAARAAIERQAEADHQFCLGFGTDRYAWCRQQRIQQWNAAQAAPAYSGGGRGADDAALALLAIQPRSITCSTFMGTTTCR